MNRIRVFILNLFKKIKDKDSFTHGLSWTFSATSFSFLLQLVFSPVLSRIYGPEAYGEFAIFNVIVTNLSTFSTLAYPQALLTTTRKNNFFSLSLFIVISTSIVLTFTSAIYLPFQSLWSDLFPNIKSHNWFPIIIIAVLLNSVNEIFSKWNIKRKRFNRNAKYGLSGQLISKIYAILFGIKVSDSGIGIISSELVKAIWKACFLLSRIQIKSVAKQFKQLKTYGILKSIITAKNKINYPKFIWPGNWLNMFSSQLPVLIFTGFFSLNELGAYTFAASLIIIPSRLIGNAIGPVFFQKSQELYELEDIKALGRISKRISLYMLLISLPLFLFIIFFGPYIFQLIFGEDWILSGKIASYLAITQISAFSISPLSSLFLSLKKEKKLFHFQIFLFTVRLLSLGLGILLDFDFLRIVLLYSISNFVAYLILHLLVFKLFR